MGVLTVDQSRRVAAADAELCAEHQRLKNTVVEASKAYNAEYFKPGEWAWQHRVCDSLLKLRTATRALIAFEKEHGLTQS
jgi:hypothetical protein